MKKVVHPSSRVLVCLTFAGVGGFALDIAPPGLLHKGFQDLSLLLGYRTPLFLPSMGQMHTCHKVLVPASVTAPSSSHSTRRRRKEGSTRTQSSFQPGKEDPRFLES